MGGAVTLDRMDLQLGDDNVGEEAQVDMWSILV
jgi:hypothetical protein